MHLPLTIASYNYKLLKSSYIQNMSNISFENNHLCITPAILGQEYVYPFIALQLVVFVDRSHIAIVCESGSQFFHLSQGFLLGLHAATVFLTA